MQAAIDRVIKTYVMLADFTSKGETNARAESPEICRTEVLTQLLLGVDGFKQLSGHATEASCIFSAARRRVAPVPDRAS